MALLSSYILVLLCMTTAIPLVHCIDADLYIVTPYLQVSEDVGSVFINISSRGTVERKAYLQFLTERGYGLAIPRTDYEFSTINETSNIFNFTISPGTTMSFKIVIIDDSIAEFRDEYLFYDLYVYGLTGIDYIGQRSIIIEDNDGAYFNEPRYYRYVREEVGNVELCVNYIISRDDLPQTVNVSVNTSSDYDQDLIFNENGVSFILMGTSSVCFDMFIIDDEENDLNEYLYFNLYFYNGSLTQLIDRFEIEVFDNEKAAYVGFEDTTYSVVESDGMVNVCLTVDRGDGTEEFWFYLYIVNITTQGVTYHEVVPYGPVTFLVDDIIQCVNINITDDKIEEDIQFFQISFYDHYNNYKFYALHGDPRIYLVYSNATAIITIYDDDLTCVPECVNGVCRDPRVCVCEDGYAGEDCSQDIDECMDEDHGCNQTCVNTPGSYYCNCDSGFQPVNATECEDIDECTINLTCHQLCVNTLGSYHCNCFEGYRLAVGFFCQDIDECLEMSDNCSRSELAPAKCINQAGSFRCSCDDHSGYRLSTDGTTCEAPCPDLSNPTNGTVAMTGNSVGDTATYTCNNVNGEIVLTCQRNGTWDNPPPTCAVVVIGFESVFYEVDEEDIFVRVNVRVLSGNLYSPVTGRLTTHDGSAKAPGDYSSIDEDITFSPSTVSFDVVITLSDDNVFENEFTIELTINSTTVIVEPAMATILITDDDRFNNRVFCYAESDCSNIFVSDSVDNCCVTEVAQSYRNSTHSRICNFCYVYGWMKDISSDFQTAEPLTTIESNEGEELILHVYFMRNGPSHTDDIQFTIYNSGTANEGVDYLLFHSHFLTLTNRPLSVNVTLLNDGESGEGLETINLTLVQNHQLTPSDQNQILYYKSVVITLQDTDKSDDEGGNNSIDMTILSIVITLLILGLLIVISATVVYNYQRKKKVFTEILSHIYDVTVTQRNGVIIHYTLSCSPSPSTLPYFASQAVPVTVIGFTPDTRYICSVKAHNGLGPGPAAQETFKTQPDYAFFQLRLTGIRPCSELIFTSTKDKLEDIASAVLDQLIVVCGDDCDITSDIIDIPSFDCDPDSTTTTVIYLARLSGTSERYSDYLITVIQDWVNDGAIIRVAGIRMTVDTKCAVSISSLDELECEIPSIEMPTTNPTPHPSPDPTPHPTPHPSPEPTPDPTPHPSPEPTPDQPITDPSSASDNTTAIVGGLVVAVILIIAITVTVIAIAAMVLKSRRHGDAYIKNAPQKHELSVLPGSPVKGVSITTSTNGAYEMMKQGLGVESEGYEVIDVQQRGGPTLTGVEAAYELPSIPDQPLPDTPSPLCKTGQEKDDDEDGVYETIPGDN